MKLISYVSLSSSCDTHPTKLLLTSIVVCCLSSPVYLSILIRILIMIPLAIDKLYFNGIEMSRTDSDSGMSEIPSNDLGTIRKEKEEDSDMREKDREREREQERERESRC